MLETKGCEIKVVYHSQTNHFSRKNSLLFLNDDFKKGDKKKNHMIFSYFVAI